ncbi:MAG: hypothetical protein ACKVYV_07205 [Limisphaerales bacterium]
MNNPTKLLKSIALAILAAVAAPLVMAEPDPADAPRRRVDDYRWYNDTRLGETYNARTRRSSTFQEAVPRAERATPPPAATTPPPSRDIQINRTPAPTRSMSTAESGGNCLRLAIMSPGEAILGENVTYTLRVTASCDVANVRVSDEIPEGADFVSSDPAAERSGSKLNWMFPKMMNGETKEIKVTVKPGREGSFTSCATGSADPLVCATFVVGKPRLEIEKTGPETARLGADVGYNVVVRNVGTAIARSVVVTDTVPPGLGGPKTLTFDVGDLAPGASRSIPVGLKAAEKGRHCNVASAKGTNTDQVQDDACTLVQQPSVDITKKVVAPGENFIGRNVDFEIVVTNNGDVPLSNVVVTDGVPNEVRIVTAEGATVSGSSARWSVGNLGVGQSRTFKVTEVSATPGRWCNTASVTTAEGPTDSAEACGVWRGITGILVELVDDPDPILIGQTTTLTFRVTNQGNVDDTNIQNVLTVDNEMEIVSTTAGTANGRSITFPNIPVLRPKQTVEYKVVVKGVAVGDSRTRTTTIGDTTRNTPGNRDPIEEMESTQVY